MKKCVLVLIITMMFLSCFSQQIDNIYNINHEYLHYDFHFFSGPLHYYEDRLIVCNQYSIMEFNVLPDGELELVEIFETKLAFIVGHFIDEDRLYFTYTNDSMLNILVFDLSVSPMVQIFDIGTPTPMLSGGSQIVTDDHIIISDSSMQRSYYYSKETLTYEGVINNLYGLVAYNDDTFVKVFLVTEEDGYTQTILRFYDKNDILLYEHENYFHEMVFSSYIWVVDIRIKDDILYVLGVANLFLIDISDINNPHEMFNIFTEHETFYYVDAKLYGDYLITTTRGPSCLRIYNISDYQNIYVEFEDQILVSSFSNTSIIYPYLYVCSWAGFKSYDMSNNYEIALNYGKSYFDIRFYVAKDDFYTALYDEHSNVINFYSALLNEVLFTLEIDFPFNSFTAFSIEDNMLYMLYSDSGVTYLDIYNIQDNIPNLIFSNSVIIESAQRFRYINGFIYLGNIHNRSEHVYQLIDNDLVLYCTIQGNLNLGSRLSDLDYIVSVFNNRFYFRDINAPDNILFTSPILSYAQLLPSLMLDNYVAGSNIEGSIAFFYKYSFDENIFSQISVKNFDRVNIFNNVITDNGHNNSYVSKYYSLINNQVVEIGSLEVPGAISFTYFYPEQNKIVLFKMSGFHVYSFDYTVSTSDQVVEVNRDTYVYPNPVNGGDVNFKTNISGNDTEISIYNIKGQLVKTSKAFQTKDNQSIFTWDKKNSQNQSVASGVYFYKIKNDTSVKTGKFLIIK